MPECAIGACRLSNRGCGTKVSTRPARLRDAVSPSPRTTSGPGGGGIIPGDLPAQGSPHTDSRPGIPIAGASTGQILVNHLTGDERFTRPWRREG